MTLKINQRYETKRGALIPRSHFLPEAGNIKGTPLAVIEVITKQGQCERFVQKVMTKKELKKELGIGKEQIDIQ